MPDVQTYYCHECCGQVLCTPSEFFQNHTRECNAPGCDYEYCPTRHDICPSCEGNGRCDCGDCEECGYREAEPESGVFNWDYKPSPDFHGVPGAIGKAPYHIGFELEITTQNMNAEPIYEWARSNGCPNLFYVKQDGSVSGFEIVTHPMSPNYFNTQVNWEAFFAMLQRNWPCDEESYEHGLHVHVSRKAFDRKSTLARWTYLLHRNRAQVERVARRRGSSWAKFAEYPVSALLPYARDRYPSMRHTVPYAELETVFSRPLCGVDGCQNCGFERRTRVIEPSQPLPFSLEKYRRHTQYRMDMNDRYQAVNLQNTNTVEMRVFRSTRNVEEFINSIHFVFATVDFVRSMQPCHATNSTTWEMFGHWVLDHPDYSYDAESLLGVSASELYGGAAPVVIEGIRSEQSISNPDYFYAV